ncbi:hypothetical protein CDV36_004508 [Fusarium kuroshium]|uniref:Uncharacterized protein n=1 Tax=Fusarium kuroshium TaxID=2010991 RepID=A0A3M2SE62_9HYPO|nr:hypothetical protein CDV36_004508 [Fusarium kuroshium]
MGWISPLLTGSRALSFLNEEPPTSDSQDPAPSKLKVKLRSWMWLAATQCQDGAIQSILQRLDDTSEEPVPVILEREVIPSSGKTFSDDPEAGPKSNRLVDLGKEIDAILESGGEGIDDDIEVLRKAAANTYRTLAPQERVGPLSEVEGRCSVLFIAICRGHDKDAEYLLRNHKIDLTFQSSKNKRTVLFQAVAQKKANLVSRILQHPFMAPSHYINLGDSRKFTVLHQISGMAGEYVDNGVMWGILDAILQYGPNVDALNEDLQTPLHQLIVQDIGKESKRCLERLLDADAEFNTQDNDGNSPLHDACRKRNHTVIKMLLERGAELDCFNDNGKTPRDLFKGDGLNEEDKRFFAENLSFLQKAPLRRKTAGNVPQKPAEYSEDIRKICNDFPVYFRYQWAGLKPKPDGSTSMSWTPTGIKVSHVLYRKKSDSKRLEDDSAQEESERESTNDGSSIEEPVDGGTSFLADCEANFASEVWGRLVKEDADISIEKIPESPQERGKSKDEIQKERGMEGRREESIRVKLTEDEFKQNVRESSWRWINFNSNNMTWIKDFLITNIRTSDGAEVDAQAWQFFESNIRVRETNDLCSRVRKPHARVAERPNLKDQLNRATAEKKAIEKQEKTTKPPVMPEKRISWTNAECFIKPSSMVSLVIPFLDIETLHDPETETDKGEILRKRYEQLERTYSPFTGMLGAQRPQTLDQTANHVEQRDNTLRTKDQQVVYRWLKDRIDKTKEKSRKEVQVEEIPKWAFIKWLWSRMQRKGKTKVRTTLEKAKKPVNKPANMPFLPADNGHVERRNKRRANKDKAKKIQQDLSLSWLMVRQLWLWKLDDNTIITAIPARKNETMADDLFETIRQGNLDTLRTPSDLIKRIVFEAVTLVNEFKWAGLGEHVLDIFEGQIGYETDEEAKFFKNFTTSDWSPSEVNTIIRQAADSTWRVKDIRDELRLLRQLFETQLKVVKDVAEILWPSRLPGQPTLTKDVRKILRESFVHDTGLETLVQRTQRMDRDASTTLEGLSNIIQAMQAQASLKEAEAARFMNFIILPFTIVTVIFTPLSFLTSLFAINTNGFPHNEEGELRLTSGWLSWRMVVGEISTLIPLGLLVLVIYYHQTEKKKSK